MIKRTDQQGDYHLTTTILRVLGTSVGGVVNYLLISKPAILLRTLLKAIVGENLVGISITQSPSMLTMPESPAFALSIVNSGTAGNSTQNPALLTSIKSSGVGTQLPQSPACKMTEISYGLTRIVGGNSAAITTAGTQGWASQANSVDGTNGKHNATVATFTGNLTAARNGTLTLGYADHVNKRELAITSVKLRFYYAMSGTTLNNADVQLKWNKGGSDVALATITGNISNIAAGEVYDITSSITGWDDLDALNAKVVCDAALGENWTCTVDSIEVEVLANKTDTL